MKKFFIGFFSIIFICLIIFFIIIDKFNVDTILFNIEEQTGLTIKLKDVSEWKFYPSIIYKNQNIIITNKKNSLQIRNAEVIIKKSYWPMSPFYIYLLSPVANYKGMEIRHLKVNAKYWSNIINIVKLSGKIVDGNLELSGQFDLDEAQPFNVKGKFNNIPLNTLLRQSKVANWERVNIKLSSPNFFLSGIGKNDIPSMNYLKGTIPIIGSFYLISSEEERFGAAILSLLVEKIPNLSSISKSIDFLLSKYANIPSSLEGTLTIQDGLIQSNEILITNKGAKSTLKGTYNFLNDIIDGTVSFYDNDEIFLEASLKGKIENPQILVGGKVFTDNDGQPLQDIKKLFDEGISSFLDKLLQVNE